jgi:multiple antibiotic resistance protein
MNQALEDILKFSITLLSILNPLGIIPIFINITRNSSATQIVKISNSCSLAVMITIFVSLIAGQKALEFFGISIASFTIGGGILISTMAFSMINAHSSGAKINEEEINHIQDLRELGIVPLAIPLLSGPGAISTSIIHAKSFDSTYHWIGSILAILVLGLIVKITLSSSKKIGEKLGTIGLNVMTRVMGIILLAISIEMIIGGVKEILPILKNG